LILMGKRLALGRHVLSPVSVCVGLWMALGGARGQAVSPAVGVKVPSYDVVSIKPDKTESGRVSVHIDDGNLDALNVTLKMMIMDAYGLKEAQVVGLPKWGESAHFDVKAKIIDPDKKQLEALTEEEFASMQQPILAERFQLKFHREMKKLPVYELVTVKGGPKFKDSTPAELKGEQGVGVHHHKMVAMGVSMSALVDQLSAQVQRVVLDKTGLTGKYSLQLSWSPDDAPPAAADVATPPDIFTALEEQLGLRLQPGKADVDVLVIDHVEMPSEN
jgi:uncharacterized protein (TIGR03435 family)